jgi:uncharacterized membrane protein YqaE (UPF0057 family)
MIAAIFLILITILGKSPDTNVRKNEVLIGTVPPIGVFLVAGCGADLLINICLTLLGYVLPSFLHSPFPKQSIQSQ